MKNKVKGSGAFEKYQFENFFKKSFLGHFDCLN
jgi:hypothetical protein